MLSFKKKYTLFSKEASPKAIEIVLKHSLCSWFHLSFCSIQTQTDFSIQTFFLMVRCLVEDHSYQINHIQFRKVLTLV